MIANHQELEVVTRQLQDLHTWRNQVLQRPTDKPFMKRVTVMGIERMIERLQEEIREYESSRYLK